MPGWVVYDNEKERPYAGPILKTRKAAEALREDLLLPYPVWSFWRRRIIVKLWKSPRLPYKRGYREKCATHPQRHVKVCDVSSRKVYCEECWSTRQAAVAAE